MTEVGRDRLLLCLVTEAEFVTISLYCIGPGSLGGIVSVVVVRMHKLLKVSFSTKIVFFKSSKHFLSWFICI